MERSFLAESLQDAKVPPELRAIIIQWMEAVEYIIPYQGAECRVASTRGVRQGCKISPLLWAIFTGLFMNKLAELISMSWVIEQLTAYADDFHTAHTAHTARDLDKELGKIGKMFDLLAKMGMKVNPRKSAALFRVRGSFAKKWLQRNTVKSSEGRSLLIKCPSGDTILIPIKDEHLYLGVKISFHKISAPTAQHRQQIAAAAWHRLRPVLCKRSLLSLPHRIQIWRACIPATLLHGLLSSHIREEDFRRVRNVMVKQIRAVTRSPAHLYHESTASLLSRLNLPDPWDMLVHEAEQQWAAWQDRAAKNPHHITACSLEGDMMKSNLDRVCRMRAQQGKNEVGLCETQMCAPKLHVCPICGHEATTHRLNRVHQAKVHGMKAGNRVQLRFNRAIHAKQGLPICALCHREFHLWTNLEKHITTGQCPGVAEGKIIAASANQTELEQLTQPVACRKELMSQIRRQGWQELLSNKPLCSLLVNHCVLCHQWAAKASGLKKHMSTHHPEWERWMPKMLQMAALTKRTIRRPCHLCLQTSFDKGRHWKQCQVVLSLTFLQCLSTANPSHDDADGRAREILRLPDDECQDGGGRQCPSQTETNHYTSYDIQSRQRRRQEQRGRQESRQTDLAQWFGARKRIDLDDGAAAVAARTLDKCASSGQYVSSVFEKWGRKSDRHSVQGRAEMEEDKRRAATGLETKPQGMPSTITTRRIQSSALELSKHRVSEQVRYGTALVQSGRMALRTVECGDRGDPGDGEQACAEHGDSACRHRDAAKTDGGQRSQVLRYQKVDGKPGDSMGGVPAGDLTQGQWHQGLGDTPDMGGAASATSLGCEAPSGKIGTQRFGPSGAECSVTKQNVNAGDPAIAVTPDQCHILQAALHNPGNHCYMNHTVLCLLWCQVSLRLPGISSSPLLNAIHESLALHPVLALMQYMPWTCLMQDWDRPNMQHDSAEFAAFVLQRLRWGQAVGQWEARLLVDTRVQIRDRHTTLAPISIPLSPGEPTMNAGVQMWHSQAAIHALKHRVPLICLHVLRFRQVARGQWVKDERSLHWQDTICMPCFVSADSLEVIWLPYKIVAISLHVGSRPSSGHYQALLITEGNHHWETDDNRAAKSVRTPTPAQHKQAYMFWCTLDVSRQHGEPQSTSDGVAAMRTVPAQLHQESAQASVGNQPAIVGSDIVGVENARRQAQEMPIRVLSTQSYAEVEGVARSGGTLHCPHWSLQ